MSDLFQQLQAIANDEVYTLVEKLHKSNSDNALLFAELSVAIANECRILRCRYENHIKNGFTEDQAMTLILGGK